MGEVDNERFDHVLKLADGFEKHMDEDNRVVSWEEMKAEIEVLSMTEKEILLDLVTTKRKTNEPG